jgi:hypothetical protein
VVGKKGGRGEGLGWRRGADSERSTVGMEGLRRGRGAVGPREETDAAAIGRGRWGRSGSLLD